MTTAPTMKRKYRLLVGIHSEPDPTIQPWNREVDPRAIDPKTGEPKITTWPHDRVYRAGEIIESEYDLLKYNAPGMSLKFALLQEEQDKVFDDAYRVGYEAAKRELANKAATNNLDAVQRAAEQGASGLKVPDTFSYMTLDELRKTAAEESVAIADDDDRDKIIAKIQTAMSS